MTRDILELISESLELEINRDEVREIERYIESENDFYVEIDGQEYRFIHENVIWDIYVDGIKDLTEECYLVNDGAKQWWIAIDWEKTAEKLLSGAETLKDMWAAVTKAYSKQKLSTEVALQQAQVARICRASDFNFKTKKVIPWTPPI